MNSIDKKKRHFDRVKGRWVDTEKENLRPRDWYEGQQATDYQQAALGRLYNLAAQLLALVLQQLLLTIVILN